MRSGGLVLWLVAAACVWPESLAVGLRPRPSFLALIGARRHRLLQHNEATEVDTESPLQSWEKRSSPLGEDEKLSTSEGQAEEVAEGLKAVEASLATNFLRHARSGTRPYDVPQIGCPPTEDDMARFPCPSPDSLGRYRCIDDHLLCDGFIDCPDGEDEDRKQCMFYKTTKVHVDILSDAIIRWVRGRK